MRIKVTRARRNPVAGVETWYATSRTKKGVRYMVLRFALPNPLFICQCNDSFGRRLPHLGQNTYSHCGHSKAVRKARKA
jgi:hypothetical protein